MKRLYILFVAIILTGCMSTNQFLGMGGANGTKENLPVGIEVLLEMAEYCERIYDDGEEIRDNESHNVVPRSASSLLSSVLITVEMCTI